MLWAVLFFLQFATNCSGYSQSSAAQLAWHLNISPLRLRSRSVSSALAAQQLPSQPAQFRSAGPSTPSRVYDDSALWDRIAIGVFRNGLVKSVGYDVSTPGYEGLMELALDLNRKYKPSQAHAEVRRILRDLFPQFIIRLFPLMFSGPLPAFSAKLNAKITQLTCAWLMGPMEMLDVEQARTMQHATENRTGQCPREAAQCLYSASQLQSSQIRAL